MLTVVARDAYPRATEHWTEDQRIAHFTGTNELQHQVLGHIRVLTDSCEDADSDTSFWEHILDVSDHYGLRSALEWAITQSIDDERRP